MIRFFLRAVTLIPLILICQAACGQQILNKLKSDIRGIGRAAVVRLKPDAGSDTAIEDLAREIDWLEAHIDKYGSVVAKHPDVWGESRLTKFRSEYDSELAKRLGCFAVRDNARIARSDLAFLASATGIGRAIDGKIPDTDVNVNMTATADKSEQATSKPGEGTSTPPAPKITQTFSGTLKPLEAPSSITKAQSSLEQTEELNQLSRYLNHLHQLRRVNAGDDTSDAPGYSLNLVRIPISIIPGRETRRGYGAEATITARPHLADTLLPETFHSMVVNDLVDQLALPVLKIAERAELEHFIKQNDFALRYEATLNNLRKKSISYAQGDAPKSVEESLDQVFGKGQLVLNVGVAQRFINHAIEVMKEKAGIAPASEKKQISDQIDFIRSAMSEIKVLAAIENGSPNLKSTGDLTKEDEQLCFLAALSVDELKRFEEWKPNLAKRMVAEAISKISDNELKKSLNAQELESLPELTKKLTPLENGTNKTVVADLRQKIETLEGWSKTATIRSKELVYAEFEDYKVRDLKSNAQEKINQIGIGLTSISNIVNQIAYEQAAAINPVSRRRRSTLPIPQVLLSEVVDEKILMEIALAFRSSYKGQMVAWNENPEAPEFHLGDIQHYLQTCLDGAYVMVTQPENRELLANSINGMNGGLGAEVRLAHAEEIKSIRDNFLNQLKTPGAHLHDGEGTSRIMAILAWPVVVEMALLNDQLNKDVHEIAVTRGDCGCQPSQKQAYYLPMPEDPASDSEFQAATQQFQEYVRCRWPIQVFHVDPVNEEQNVQSSSLLGRELTIAAALAVSTGKMNFQQANQFVRQYREQIETIDLNRTITGFSHGSDTFGWRFQPRVQIHPTRSNITAFRESLIGRGPNENLRDAAIEPGMRECTAIVLMPSFVPYCDFDVSTSWYRLDNPRSTELTMHATMKLSRSIKHMQDCSLQCVKCEHLYREGEVDRLMKRVHQLENQLPLQSMRVQIPYENTLGGFELFSNGVTDLAPELVGWYGAPGIRVGDGELGCTASCAEGTKPESSLPEDCKCRTTAIETLARGTSVFLVGDNFSVHETRIVAGGVEIPRDHIRMISRQVIQVTVPTCVATVDLDVESDKPKHKYVAIYAATPYGVTSHLHVPMVEYKAKATKEAEASAKNLEELKKTIVDLKAELTKSPFTWTKRPLLPVVTSYTQNEKTIQRSCIALGNIAASEEFELTWRNDISIPILNDFKTTREAGLVGQFEVDGKVVGGTFWITKEDDKIELTASSKILTAMDLLSRLELPIRENLPPDKTGNKEVVTVLLKTYVVVTEPNSDIEVAQGKNKPNKKLRLLARPIETSERLEIKLIRRENPPTSQQCVDPKPTAQNPKDENSQSVDEIQFRPLPVWVQR